LDNEYESKIKQTIRLLRITWLKIWLTRWWLTCLFSTRCCSLSWIVVFNRLCNSN